MGNCHAWRLNQLCRFVVLAIICVFFAGTQSEANEAPLHIGRITALKGTVLIARDQQSLKAEREGKVFLGDSLRTKESSRVKMRFIDDSSLTLSENSYLNIREYFHDRETKEGRSVFELLDGHLRTLVGENELEIHTPTAVAAARGTFFFVQVRVVNNVLMTEISLLEGTLEVRGKDGDAGEPLILEPGMTTTITENEPPSSPLPIKDVQLKELLNCTTLSQ